MMEEIIVECSTEDIKRLRDIPDFEGIYQYPKEEGEGLHSSEYGRVRIGNTVLRFRVYSQDLKTRVLDSYGSICLHLGRIRAQILNEDDCMDDIKDLRDFIQMCIQTYV